MHGINGISACLNTNRQLPVDKEALLSHHVIEPHMLHSKSNIDWLLLLGAASNHGRCDMKIQNAAQRHMLNKTTPCAKRGFPSHPGCAKHVRELSVMQCESL